MRYRDARKSLYRNDDRKKSKRRLAARCKAAMREEKGRGYIPTALDNWSDEK